MSDSDYFRSSPIKVSYERYLAYRRAMADASDESDALLVLAVSAADPLVSFSAFTQLFNYANSILASFRSVHSDK